MPTLMSAYLGRAGAAAVVALVLALLPSVVARDTAHAYGHSIYSYKAGKNCQGVSNRVDPVTVFFLTQHVTVADMAVGIEDQSRYRHGQDSSIPIWDKDYDDDIRSQQGKYIRDGQRICSSFSASNATGGPLRSRYHIRLHTGGASTAQPGRNVIAGTPHYDKLCGIPPHHEVWTFEGARTQLSKLFPASQYDAYWKYVGNTYSRHMKCLNKDVSNASGMALFILF